MNKTTDKGAPAKSAAGSESTLENLYRELAAKRDRALAEVEADFQRRAQALEAALAQRHEAELARRRQAQDQRLRRRRLEHRRITQEALQHQRWQHQRACIESLIDTARQQLPLQSPPDDYLERWLARVQPRLAALGTKRLRLSREWSEQLPRPALAVIITPLLGGAILEDPSHHLEIDGSWDRRLESLIPQLWQRWLDHVGTHDPN